MHFHVTKTALLLQTKHFVLSFSLNLLLGLVICCGAQTYFLDRGYNRIAAMRAMEREWQALRADLEQ